MNAIPEEWIKKYVDTLTDTAASLPVGPFRDAVAMRAEHAMDLVKAWRESVAVQPPAAMSAEEHCRMFCAWKGGGPCLANDCPRRTTYQPNAARKTVWKPYDVFGVTGRLVYEDTGEDVPDQPGEAAK